MVSRVLVLGVVLGLGACAAHAPPRAAHCYLESGWLDASNGCSDRAGYPDCFLVCPDQDGRHRLGGRTAAAR